MFISVFVCGTYAYLVICARGSELQSLLRSAVWYGREATSQTVQGLLVAFMRTIVMKELKSYPPPTPP